MFKYIIVVALLLNSIVASGQFHNHSLQTNRSVEISQLEKGFITPPEESKLRCYWWWLNSMVTKESITRDLEEMKTKGYGGALIFDAGTPPNRKKIPAGPVFMGPEWMKLYQHAVREADRLKIELSVNVQSGWNPGAPSITPEMAQKKLVYTETEVTGGKPIRIALPQAETNFIYRDVRVQAIPMPSKKSPVKNDAIVNWSVKSFSKAMGWQGIYPLHELRDGFDNQVKVDIIRKSDIIDLTAKFDGKQLKWDVPEGDWLVIRYGWTCTGARTSRNSDGWEGLSVDHLNPDAFKLFQKTVIEPLIDSAQAVGNSVRFLFTDSWEMGIVNWTNRFPEAFEKFRGYEIDKYLPVMTGRVVESQEVSNRFLHDLRKTVGDCVVEYHYKLFSEVAHEHGLGIHPESGGPHSAPVDALRVMGISDYPQGEFWARSNTHRVSEAARLSVKQAASVAHTNGKRIVGAEGPTSIGPQWERSPRELKATIDRVFCSGINRITWQIFTASPKEFGIPGNNYFNGTPLNQNEVWWEKAGDFTGYLNRNCFMLQQGLSVADVLYYYGDDVPNFVFLKEEYPELNFGYDWDKCSKDVILNRVSVSNGKIVLPDGMDYHVLVLAPEQAIDLKVLRKVEQLVKDGITIIAPRPKESTGLSGYPESDKELTAIASRLWGNIDGKAITENHYGKGRVIWGQNINDVLAGMSVKPDFAFTSPDKETALDYTHRTSDNTDIYLVSNRHARKGINDYEYRYLTSLPDHFEQVECKFRVTGKIPELWNPQTGEIKPVLTYREEDGQTIIPLHFSPEGSVFVVFKKEKPQNHVVKLEKDGQHIFPGNLFAAKKHPYIQFDHSGNGWMANIFESGSYQLYWSDGKVQTVETNNGTSAIPVTGSWNVHFDPVWGGPESVVFNELKSWTDFSEEGIKYYSGKAVYKKILNVDKGKLKNKKVLLSLGNLHEMAAVTLNDHQFELSWTAPYELDLTNFMQSGKNKLEVKIFNMWPNRLIGDGKLPEAKRFTRTHITKFEEEGADSLLRQSGLLGPVQLFYVDQQKL